MAWIIAWQQTSKTHSVGLDISVDELVRLGVHGNGAGAIHKPASNDGLAVDARKGLGRIGRKDRGLLGRHGDCFEIWDLSLSAMASNRTTDCNESSTRS